VVSSTLLPLNPLGKSCRYPLDRRLRGPEPIWTMWRRRNPCLCRDSNTDPSIVQPVTSRYTDYVIPAYNTFQSSIKYFSTSKIWLYLPVTAILYFFKLQNNIFYCLFYPSVSDKFPWKRKGAFQGYDAANSNPKNI
jgi:hypothetical protein